MKKTLLSIILIALPVSTFFAIEPNENGPGAWHAWTQGDCGGENEICAEWIQANSSLNGTVCCIDQFAMQSHSFDECIYQVSSAGPREGENL